SRGLHGAWMCLFSRVRLSLASANSEGIPARDMSASRWKNETRITFGLLAINSSFVLAAVFCLTKRAHC
ncbi:MAG TPA: hypothetical protein VIJ93_04760, partial [bacterium]